MSPPENYVYNLTGRCFSVFKNVSSSKSQCDSWTLELRDYEILAFFFLAKYEMILINISMNANNMKTHILYKIKYDLRGHLRLHKVILNPNYLITTLTYVLMGNFRPCYL